MNLLKSMQRCCRRMVFKGVFINGSSGEGYMLTEEERMKLAERWVSVAPAGFKVIVHVGSCCVKASRMLAEHAQKIGATAIGAMAHRSLKLAEWKNW